MLAELMAGLRLYFSVQTGRMEIVQLLLDADASANAFANDRMTSLLVAAERGHIDIFEALAPRGANLKATNSQGLNAFKLAVQGNHLTLVRRFLDKKTEFV